MFPILPGAPQEYFAPAAIGQILRYGGGGLGVSVVAYGADPTGSWDISKALGRAIAGLTQGGVVYFPPGVYLLDPGNFVLEAPGVTLAGAGAGASQVVGNLTLAGNASGMAQMGLTGNLELLDPIGVRVVDCEVGGNLAVVGAGAVGLSMWLRGTEFRGTEVQLAGSFAGCSIQGCVFPNLASWTDSATGAVELVGNAGAGVPMRLGLPTALPGVAGIWWNNGGVVEIS